MQTPHRNVITYNVTRFLEVPIVHHTLDDLDGSSSSSIRFCLNDMLLVGPTVQKYSLSFLLRIRTYQIALSEDIDRNSREVKIRQDDRNL
jgi:hypothetical protein